MMRSITLLGFVPLTGCFSLGEASHNPESAAETAATTTVEHDLLKREMTILGPPLRMDPTCATNWRLRYVTSAGGGSLAIVLQLYHGQWQFFQSAHSAAGERLDMWRVVGEVVSRAEQDGPLTRELYLIDVSPDQFDRWARTGAEIRVRGQTSEGVLSLPAPYFRGFRDVMQRTAAPVR